MGNSIQKHFMYVLAGEKYERDSDAYKFIVNHVLNGVVKDKTITMKNAIYRDQLEDVKIIAFTKSDKDPTDKNGAVYVNFVGFFVGENKTKIENSDDNLCDNKHAYCLVSLPTFASNYFKKGKLHPESKQFIVDKYVKRLQWLLDKYHDELRKRDDLYYHSTNQRNNKLAFAREFFRLYETHGLYQEKEKVISHTKGRTSWQKTVNKITPDMVDGNIIYRKVIKEKKVELESDIGMLQAAVINTLMDDGYVTMLDIMLGDDSAFPAAHLQTTINIQDILNNRHEKNRWLKRIRDKKSRCFKDSERKILSMLEMFLENQFMSGNNNAPIYGVMKFDVVYERVLSDFFGNIIEIGSQEFRNGKPILPIRLNSEKYKRKKLKKLKKDNSGVKKNNSGVEEYVSNDFTQLAFNGVQYNLYSNNETKKRSINNGIVFKTKERDSDKGNLIPDIITEYPMKKVTGDDYTILMDAKYHDYTIETRQEDVDGVSTTITEICGLPQNNDVIKQFKYEEVLQRAYGEMFDIPEGIEKPRVINAFLIPWKREYDSDRYDSIIDECEDGAGNINRLNVFVMFGEAVLGEQKIIYVLVNFDAIVELCKRNVKAADANYIEDLIEGAKSIFGWEDKVIETELDESAEMEISDDVTKAEKEVAKEMRNMGSAANKDDNIAINSRDSNGNDNQVKIVMEQGMPLGNNTTMNYELGPTNPELRSKKQKKKSDVAMNLLLELINKHMSYIQEYQKWLLNFKSWVNENFINGKKEVNHKKITQFRGNLEKYIEMAWCKYHLEKESFDAVAAAIEKNAVKQRIHLESVHKNYEDAKSATEHELRQNGGVI